MERTRYGTIGLIAGLGMLALMAAPVAAHGPGQGGSPGMGMGMMGPGMMMGQPQGGTESTPQAPAPAYGTAPGMMGPGMGYGMGPRMMMGPGYGYGPGMGYGMGPGMMMGQGYGYGPGMGYGMGPGMMMGPGYGYGPGMGYGMGYGMMHAMMHNMMHGGAAGYGPSVGMGYGGPCWQQGAATSKDLEPENVKARMERWLAMQGNDRLKLGKIEAVDDDTITVEIVTVDDSLVQKLAVDRHSGWTRPAQ